MNAIVDPHRIRKRWRRVAHQHAQQYRALGKSAQQWEDRIAELGVYNHVLPQRELDAIMHLVWHL